MHSLQKAPRAVSMHGFQYLQKFQQQPRKPLPLISWFGSEKAFGVTCPRVTRRATFYVASITLGRATPKVLRNYDRKLRFLNSTIL